MEIAGHPWQTISRGFDAMQSHGDVMDDLCRSQGLTPERARAMKLDIYDLIGQQTNAKRRTVACWRQGGTYGVGAALPNILQMIALDFHLRRNDGRRHPIMTEYLPRLAGCQPAVPTEAAGTLNGSLMDEGIDATEMIAGLLGQLKQNGGVVSKLRPAEKRDIRNALNDLERVISTMRAELK